MGLKVEMERVLGGSWSGAAEWQLPQLMIPNDAVLFVESAEEFRRSVSHSDDKFKADVVKSNCKFAVTMLRLKDMGHYGLIKVLMERILESC